MTQLRVERGTEPGRCYPLGDEAYLGRGKDCEVQIEAQDISRKQARIFLQQDRHWVEDLQSRNGTSVNGRKIEVPVMLSPGDHIRLGRTWLSFSPDAASDPAKLLQSDFIIDERCPGPYLQYRATQRMLSRRVSLAVFPSAGRDEEIRKRFLSMLDNRARLDHRSLQVVMDYGFKDDVGYFAAEWLAGPTLKAILHKHGQLDAIETLRTGARLCDALEQIHALGCVHGGVSPDTIRMERDRPILTEIGLGELTGLHSPDYRAPEGGTTPAGDIYSLAVLLIESLTGKNPFAVHSEEQTEQRHKTLDRGPIAAELSRIAPLATMLIGAASPIPAERPNAAELGPQLRVAADQMRSGAGPTVTFSRRILRTLLGSKIACWILFPALAAGLFLAIARLTATG